MQGSVTSGGALAGSEEGGDVDRVYQQSNSAQRKVCLCQVVVYRGMIFKKSIILAIIGKITF